MNCCFREQLSLERKERVNDFVYLEKCQLVVKKDGSRKIGISLEQASNQSLIGFSALVELKADFYRSCFFKQTNELTYLQF